MNYEKAWYYLKAKLEDMENNYEKILDKEMVMKIRTILETNGKLISIRLIQQYMFDIEAESGLYTIKDG